MAKLSNNLPLIIQRQTLVFKGEFQPLITYFIADNRGCAVGLAFVLSLLNYNLYDKIKTKININLKGELTMKNKIFLTIAFVVSLLPMLMNQYGGSKGVSEVSGMINLLNPLGIMSVILFIIGVWVPFRVQIINIVTGALGTIGIVVSEVYNFFTWHVMTITGEVSIKNSVSLAFPEFYIGLVISLAMVVVYFIVCKKSISNKS